MNEFTIIASKKVDSVTMQFDCECTIVVKAHNKSDAMRKVRNEFRDFHLSVL